MTDEWRKQRECAFCGVPCTADIGCSRELHTTFWGGSTGTKITHSPKMVTFFCSDEHRTAYLYGP